MIKQQNKKWLIACLTLVILGGAWGGYSYYIKKMATPAGGEHSGHSQTAKPSVAPGAPTVTLDEKARQLAGVQTALVSRRALDKTIQTTGKVAVDESGRAFLTSRIEGRVDELYITSDGQTIAAGQPIASVYSPTYIAAQEEYILATDSVRKLGGAGSEIVQLNQRLLDASKRKLMLLGVPEGEIGHLAHTRKANTHMTVRAQFGGTVTERQTLPGAYIMPGDKMFTLADLSTVWMVADIYERDIAGVRPGQDVSVTSASYPGENFAGTVTFINPIVDDATRAVKVRVAMSNADGRLKPNMFVNAVIRTPLGEGLVIPASALLDTGEHKLVYVASDANTFVKREITIGQEAEGFIQVLSGLQPDETVVTAATFLIDSQTQLGAYGSHAGHGAGGKASTPATLPVSAPVAPAPSAPTAPLSPAAPSGAHTGH